MTSPVMPPLRESWLKKTLRIPQATFGVVIIAVTLLAAILAPWIVPVDAEEMDFDNLLKGISTVH